MSVASDIVPTPEGVVRVTRPQARVERPLPLEIAVPPGRTVVRQGEPCGRALVVVTGAMLMSMVDREGRTLALDVLGSGDLIGGPAGWVATSDVRALEICRLRPAADSLATPLLIAGDRTDRLTALAWELAWLPVAERVDRRLHDLATRFGRREPGGRSISIRLTQEDLAALCGTSRESANRALGRLAHRGCVRIVDRGRFFVRDQASCPGSADVPSCNRTRLQALQ
jgi:CRP-like cAMP-binding protein